MGLPLSRAWIDLLDCNKSGSTLRRNPTMNLVKLQEKLNENTLTYCQLDGRDIRLVVRLSTPDEARQQIEHFAFYKCTLTADNYQAIDELIKETIFN